MINVGDLVFYVESYITARCNFLMDDGVTGVNLQNLVLVGVAYDLKEWNKFYNERNYNPGEIAMKGILAYFSNEKMIAVPTVQHTGNTLMYKTILHEFGVLEPRFSNEEFKP